MLLSELEGRIVEDVGRELEGARRLPLLLVVFPLTPPRCSGRAAEEGEGDEEDDDCG